MYTVEAMTLPPPLDYLSCALGDRKATVYHLDTDQTAGLIGGVITTSLCIYFFFQYRYQHSLGLLWFTANPLCCSPRQDPSSKVLVEVVVVVLEVEVVVVVVGEMDEFSIRRLYPLILLRPPFTPITCAPK